MTNRQTDGRRDRIPVAKKCVIYGGVTITLGLTNGNCNYVPYRQSEGHSNVSNYDLSVGSNTATAMSNLDLKTEVAWSSFRLVGIWLQKSRGVTEMIIEGVSVENNFSPGPLRHGIQGTASLKAKNIHDTDADARCVCGS